MGRKQNEEFESPREPTAQEKENNDQHVVSESTKEGLLSNQVTENTNNANIPPSVKTLEIGQKGVDSEPKDNNSALVETSPKANKRMPPSGRGRGNFAPTFPGKDRSTPNGSFRLRGQNVDAVRGRGVTSKTVSTTSSPPGLTVTEEGKFFARNVCNHDNDKQETNGEPESVEHKNETEIAESKTTSSQEGTQSQECESQKQKQSQIKATDESEESSPTEEKTSRDPNLNQEKTSENALPPREKVTDLDKSREGSEADEGMKLSTTDKTKNVKPTREECQTQHSDIFEDVKGVPDPDDDSANDRRMTSHDTLVSQTTGGEMKAVIKGSVEGESIKSGPHSSSDLQSVDGDGADNKDAQAGRSREHAETGTESYFSFACCVFICLFLLCVCTQISTISRLC